MEAPVAVYFKSKCITSFYIISGLKTSHFCCSISFGKGNFHDFRRILDFHVRESSGNLLLSRNKNFT